MPYLALLQADLTQMVKSWTVRIWLGLSALLALVSLPNALSSQTTSSESLASLLAVYPLVWSTFAIIVSGGAISSEAGLVADSVLSKSVTRYEYVLAKLTSRLVTVLGVYLVVVLPWALILLRQAQGDLVWNGVFWAVLLIGMSLCLLTSLSVALSALFNRTLVAVGVAWFLWYAASGIFAVLEVEYLSPGHIIEKLPATLQGDYGLADQVGVLLGLGLLSGVFVALAVLYFNRKDV